MQEMKRIFNRTSPVAGIIGPVRFSYMNVLKPRKSQFDETAKYSVTCLIPKTDTETLANFKSMIEGAVELGRTTMWNGKTPANLTLPLKDGDESGKADYAGYWYFDAKTKETSKPTVAYYDELAGGLIKAGEGDEEKIYSGAWGNVSVKLNPYSGASKGVTCYLNAVAVIYDDERFGGGSNSLAGLM